MADSWRPRGLFHRRTCPRRSASRTSPRVRRGPRRVRSESNGVRDFSADSWRTLSGLGGVRSGGLEGGVRSESNGVQWSPMESARSPLGQRSATDIAGTERYPSAPNISMRVQSSLDLPCPDLPCLPIYRASFLSPKIFAIFTKNWQF